MSSVLESLFFAVGEDGLSIEELESILEIDEEKLNEELDNLKKLYENDIVIFKYDEDKNKAYDLKIINAKEKKKYGNKSYWNKL